MCCGLDLSNTSVTTMCNIMYSERRAGLYISTLPEAFAKQEKEDKRLFPSLATSASLSHTAPSV
jgi:hypothetical protein